MPTHPERKTILNSCQFCGHKGLGGINFDRWPCPNCSNIGDPEKTPLDQIKTLPTLTEGSKIVMTPEEIAKRIATKKNLNDIIAKKQKNLKRPGDALQEPANIINRH